MNLLKIGLLGKETCHEIRCTIRKFNRNGDYTNSIVYSYKLIGGSDVE